MIDEQIRDNEFDACDEIIEIVLKVRGSEIYRRYRRAMFAQADKEGLGDIMLDMYDTLTNNQIDNHDCKLSPDSGCEVCSKKFNKQI